MAKIAASAMLLAGVHAGTIAVTWSDCGDANTHVKITDLEPASIETGTSATVTGTGVLDEAINGGTFSAVVMAGGIKVVSCNGDASQDINCKLPLGMGQISVKALPFPMDAGTTSIQAVVSTSSVIPTSLAVTSTHVEATSDAGDALACLDLNTKAGADALEDTTISGTIAVTWSDCGDANTHVKITDLEPASIETGTSATVTGTGVLDEAINGGTFSAVVKAGGIKVVSCNGDASQDINCKLPLGVGQISVKALSFPMDAGTTSIQAVVSTSSVIPSSLAVTSTHVEATSDTGDALACLDLNTKAGANAFEETSISV